MRRGVGMGIQVKTRGRRGASGRERERWGGMEDGRSKSDGRRRRRGPDRRPIVELWKDQS